MPPWSSILRDFQNQEYQFKIPKSQIRLAEKREEGEEENKQLQSIIYTFHANASTRTQTIAKHYAFYAEAKDEADLIKIKSRGSQEFNSSL